MRAEIVTLRPDEISRERVEAIGASFAWCLRFKGVHGRGIYGSVITDQFGRGLYLLAHGDHFGNPGYERRMTCLIQPPDFQIELGMNSRQAKDMIVAALLSLGWGPLAANEHGSE